MNKISKTIFFTLLAVFFHSCASERIASINENIRHDDFIYTITDVTKGRLLKEGSNIYKTKGNLYIVRLKVTNEAKRVEHRWDNTTVYLVDSEANEYENDTEAQKVYYRINMMEYKDEYVIPAGSSGETFFIFDLPTGVKEPYLKFRGKFLIGDLLDRGQFKRTKIRLF